MSVLPIDITTFDDPRVEAYRDVRDRDLARGHGRLFMAESIHVIERLLGHPELVHSLLLSPHMLDRLRPKLEALGDALVGPVYVAPIDLMCEITGFHIHRGALAAGKRPRPEELSLDHGIGHLRGRERLTMVLCEAITHIDNMGGIFRNAAAFGADAVVIDSASCDPLYRKSIRVSMGHVFSVPYAISEDWPHDLARLRKEWGIHLVAAETTEDATPLYELEAPQRVGVIFGSEGHGLSAATLSLCDRKCAIPMLRGVPSLNVATASAVFLYELQRAGAGKGRR
jgi:tRNA G18 (ribose-2'-O)-methylase SpoU